MEITAHVVCMHYCYGLLSPLQAYYMLDELIVGGAIQESSKKNIVRAITAQDMLQEVGRVQLCQYGYNCVRKALGVLFFLLSSPSLSSPLSSSLLLSLSSSSSPLSLSASFLLS